MRIDFQVTYDPRPWREQEGILSELYELGCRTGPWDTEPDEVHWADQATGLRCMARRNTWGVWCGYVNVGRKHHLHGVPYDDLDEVLQVHGGLTFGGTWFEEGDWWFGFDCGHAWDDGPAMPTTFQHNSVYRTLDFVSGECAYLAHQLVNAPE